MTLSKTAPTVSPDSRLFKPIQVGDAKLDHRIVMAPLTRYRNDENNVAKPFVERYYSERASAPGTLVISEATGASMQDTGMPHGPAFVTEDQVAAWKKVIAGVHEKKSFWAQQIWGQGRASDPKYIKERGYKYRSSSAVPIEEGAPTPEAMTEEEIQQFIRDMVATARRVVDAGGDIVEVHGAHGYLIDQFTSDSINKRTDKWGGSIENRARLLLEVVKAISAEVGSKRVGLRLSPYASFQGSESSDIQGQYSYIINELKKIGPLAYLSLVEARGDPAKLLAPDNDGSADAKTLDFILEIWNNLSPVIVAGNYTPESAAEVLDGHYSKWDVLVAFGRHFIANPDFVYRIKHGIELTKYDRNTFYILGSEIGYVDYPFSQQYIDEQRAWAAENLPSNPK